jgi:hypothetical protein
MAELSLPILPEFLFRYRALTGVDDSVEGPNTVFDREVQAITEPNIWCADFKKLNDPMEGLFDPTRRCRAEQLRPVFSELADLSARKISAALNERKIPTPAGGEWYAATVQKRLAVQLRPAGRNLEAKN